MISRPALIALFLVAGAALCAASAARISQRGARSKRNLSRTSTAAAGDGAAKPTATQAKRLSQLQPSPQPDSQPKAAAGLPKHLEQSVGQPPSPPPTPTQKKRINDLLAKEWTEANNAAVAAAIGKLPPHLEQTNAHSDTTPPASPTQQERIRHDLTASAQPEVYQPRTSSKRRGEEMLAHGEGSPRAGRRSTRRRAGVRDVNARTEAKEPGPSGPVSQRRLSDIYGHNPTQ